MSTARYNVIWIVMAGIFVLFIWVGKTFKTIENVKESVGNRPVLTPVSPVIAPKASFNLSSTHSGQLNYATSGAVVISVPFANDTESDFLLERAASMDNIHSADPPIFANLSSIKQDPFLARIFQHVKDVHGFVFLDRFYSEHNLSFAKGQVSTNFPNARTVMSMSLDGPSLDMDVEKELNVATWARTWYKEMYLISKKGHPGNFESIAKQIGKIRYFANQSGLPIAAVRYHTYSSLCSLLKIGNPKLLPVPLMLTFKLNPSAGHWSADIPDKTCIHSKSYNREANSCGSPVIIPAYLKRCNKRVADILALLNHRKILLFLTNQHSGISHEKILSLPMGIRPHIATMSLRRIEKHIGDVAVGKAVKRTNLIGISNGFTGYHNKVIQYFSAKFHISATFDYQADPEIIHDASLPDYFDKLLYSKFTLCPPGLQGIDSYRIWEALIFGSIPIVEASPFGPSIERSFSLLPVLVVPDFLQLTKTALDDAYLCFVENADKWRFDLLQQKHWDTMIADALYYGSISHIIQDHPAYNPHCNFLLYNSTTRKWN